MNLLAAEMLARSGKDPAESYRSLTDELGTSFYRRMDAPATPQQKARLAGLSAGAVAAASLAGEPIIRKLTAAPGNEVPIGGLKVVAAGGWFAARPSGTKDIYKIYAESFKSEEHLQTLLTEAQHIVNKALSPS